MAKGLWTFPKEIIFSLQGLDFLNRLLCFNEQHRLNWPEVAQHKYLATQSTDYIPISRLEVIAQ